MFRFNFFKFLRNFFRVKIFNFSIIYIVFYNIFYIILVRWINRY